MNAATRLSAYKDNEVDNEIEYLIDTVLEDNPDKNKPLKVSKYQPTGDGRTENLST